MTDIEKKAKALIDVVREIFITENECEPTIGEIQEIAEKAIADVYYKDRDSSTV